MTLTVAPLYYEAEAARMLGITPRALRSERNAGRITYRKVAGRVMYSVSDLEEWKENIKCPAYRKDQSSGPTQRETGRTTSTGRTQRLGGAVSAQQVLANLDALMKSSPSGSDDKKPPNGLAPVVPLKFR